ncbi:transposase [Candidatus Parvarchaeota archaeon]|nr:transposase [Candidatus Parvarchaeota archaeon]
MNIKWTIINKDRKGRNLAIDASGISIANRGGYRDARYGSKPKFYKLHAVMDEDDMELVDFRLTSEHVGDNAKFSPLIREIVRNTKISVLHADGGYDSKKNFDFLSAHKIKAGIKADRNSSSKSRGSVSRRIAVREQFGYPDVGRAKTRPPDKDTVSMNEEEKRRHYQKIWKKKVGYGGRWLVEAFFSVFKRVYGSYASSITWRRVKNEMTLKLLLYDALLKI